MKVSIRTAFHDNEAISYLVPAWLDRTFPLVVHVDHVRGKGARKFDLVVEASHSWPINRLSEPKLKELYYRHALGKEPQKLVGNKATIETMPAVDIESSEEAFSWSFQLTIEKPRFQVFAQLLTVRLGVPSPPTPAGGAGPAQAKAKLGVEPDPIKIQPTAEVTILILPRYRQILAWGAAFLALLLYFVLLPRLTTLEALGDSWRVIVNLSQSTLLLGGLAIIAKSFNKHGLPLYGLSHRPTIPLLGIVLLLGITYAKSRLTRDVYNGTGSTLEWCSEKDPARRVTLPPRAWRSLPEGLKFPKETGPLTLCDGTLSAKVSPYTSSSGGLERFVRFFDRTEQYTLTCDGSVDVLSGMDPIDRDTCAIKERHKTNGLDWQASRYMNWARGRYVLLAPSRAPKSLQVEGYLSDGGPSRPVPPAHHIELQVSDGEGSEEGARQTLGHPIVSWVPGPRDLITSKAYGGLKALRVALEDLVGLPVPLPCSEGSGELVDLEVESSEGPPDRLRLACTSAAGEAAPNYSVHTIRSTSPIRAMAITRGSQLLTSYETPDADVQQAPLPFPAKLWDLSLSISLARVDEGRAIYLTIPQLRHFGSVTVDFGAARRLTIADAHLNILQAPLLGGEEPHRLTLTPWVLDAEEVTDLFGGPCNLAPGRPWSFSRSIQDPSTVWLPKTAARLEEVCWSNTKATTDKGHLRSPLPACPPVGLDCEPVVPPAGFEHCRPYCLR